MKLTLNVAADVVLDEQALDAMLGNMSFRELEYLQSRIAAILVRASHSYGMTV